MDYRRRESCRCCDGTALRLFLDLKSQPLANNYQADGADLPTAPLAVNFCPDCFHSQLSVVVEPDAMFRDYLYVSGTTATLRDYFARFAADVSRRHGGPGRVLDIGCNDGSQLAAFAGLGWRTVGVDPAQNLSDRARLVADETHCAYWGDAAASAIAGSFDAIVAQNVFAHVDDAVGFLASCKRVMTDDTRLYIQTSQADMYKRHEFDTIYHEHVSFFCAHSLKTVAARVGLTVQDVFKDPIHGTSYIFVLGKKATGSRAIDALIAAEAQEGRHDWATYEAFGARARQIVASLRDFVASQTVPVVGYGAAAKGNTLLNFGAIDLDWIVDDNPLKIGLRTPGRSTAIRGPESLDEAGDELVIVPLAWNFFDEIKQRVRQRRPEGRDLFVQYFPEMTVSM